MCYLDGKKLIEGLLNPTDNPKYPRSKESKIRLTSERINHRWSHFTKYFNSKWKIKNNKVSRVDDIPREFFKHREERLVKLLHKDVTAGMGNGEILTDWNMACLLYTSRCV